MWVLLRGPGNYCQRRSVAAAIADPRRTSATLVYAGQHVTDQAGGEELNTDDDEEDGENEQRVAVLDGSCLCPQVGDVGPYRRADAAANHAEASEDVHRRSHEPNHEGDRQQVEKTVNQSARPELRFAVLARG